MRNFSTRVEKFSAYTSLMADSALPPPVRKPRRGSGPTRDLILKAARTRFAKDGYSRSTIRGIAADAGVDASLVMQYFGSKEELFAAVMNLGPNTMSLLSQAFDGPTGGLGERVTRAFFDAWDGDPHISEPLLALFRAAIGNQHATVQLRELIQKRVIDDLDPRLRESADMTTRIEIALSMLIGVVVGRRLVEIDALVQQNREALVSYLSPGIQAVLSTHSQQPENEE